MSVQPQDTIRAQFTHRCDGVDTFFPVEPALKKLRGKWKGGVVCRLLFGTWRFNELLRSLPGCTQKVLAAQLRELEMDGIIRRELFGEIPPRVEYSLTEIGRDLLPMIRALCDWNQKHILGTEPDFETVARAFHRTED